MPNWDRERHELPYSESRLILEPKKEPVNLFISFGRARFVYTWNSLFIIIELQKMSSSRFKDLDFDEDDILDLLGDSASTPVQPSLQALNTPNTSGTTQYVPRSVLDPILNPMVKTPSDGGTSTFTFTVQLVPEI